MLRATTPCTFSTSQLPKLLRTHQFLTLFTSKCASRHNAVHFFDISTSKTAPNPSVFNTFDFQMCFAPQRRALFRHLNFQKCSETCSFLTHVTSKCASRHNAVHFFVISTSKSVPRPAVFNTFYFQMCFAPQLRALFRHLNFPKVLRDLQFLTFFTSKCASRHKAVHFFNISTSKSGPALMCFVPFHFEMCFAPQRRATFHLSSGQLAPHPPL